MTTAKQHERRAGETFDCIDAQLSIRWANITQTIYESGDSSVKQSEFCACHRKRAGFAGVSGTHRL